MVDVANDLQPDLVYSTETWMLRHLRPATAPTPTPTTPIEPEPAYIPPAAPRGFPLSFPMTPQLINVQLYQVVDPANKVAAWSRFKAHHYLDGGFNRGDEV